MTKFMSILAMAGFCVLGPADSLAQCCPAEAPADADQKGCWEELIDFG